MRTPPLGLFLFALLAGAAIGVGAYTFIYARGSSYLTDNPAACANCHIMTSYYDGWLKGSHKNAAVCNDCHTPDGIVSKYASKASNGFWHSFGFTTGRFHEPLQIKSHNQKITNAACKKCHETIVESLNFHSPSSPVSCIQCHASVGHL
ncbi:MAG TPA: cytochrome c nitrite reductase small subunit [Acidobacteriota bacterium]|nr:cytochrome c nitrite reductase small subunit [Acidobacteriota bacterium]